jgi:hypothetical protein
VRFSTDSRRERRYVCAPKAEDVPGEAPRKKPGAAIAQLSWVNGIQIVYPSNTRWYAMWKVVIDAYVSNPLVFYDIHNEPHGFTPAQWVVQVNGWLAQFPNVPRQQIIVAGSGWDDNVGNVASNWPDLMMEIHNYAYNGPTTTAGWKSNLLNRLGNAVSRTIVGEWAGQVAEDYTTGIESNADKSFIVGTANTILENKMGGCWWAGAFAMSGGTSGHDLAGSAGDRRQHDLHGQGSSHAHLLSALVGPQLIVPHR